MYQIIFADFYEKKATKFFQKHRSIIKQYEKTLQLLEVNPFHPSLRLHQLKGKLKGLYSISINISYRISVELIVIDKQIILIDVGSHDQVY